MTPRESDGVRKLPCPECMKTGTIMPIIYGMPDPETFDFEKYAVGGCCISGDGLDPDVQCKSCDWSGFRKDLI